ncbi:MAG: hypothetical protein KBF14_09340 [Synergistaceae bacterium]|nr:hypothetical protein [Synergistaceae bacterium]
MYFEKSGKSNTEQVAQCAAQYAKEHGIKHIVAASNTGYTADILFDMLPEGVQLTVVTHVIGMTENGADEMGAENRAKLAEKGIKVVTGTHVLSGVERSLSGKFGGVYPVEVMAHTLRIFGAGTKVAVECATMALDNGAIPYGEDIISIGGTGRGADTAVLMRLAHGSRIFETAIHEIICKPRGIVQPPKS